MYIHLYKTGAFLKYLTKLQIYVHINSHYVLLSGAGIMPYRLRNGNKQDGGE